MGWGTTIDKILVPGVKLADVAKRKELAKTIDGLRIEALAHAAVSPGSAENLLAAWNDWLGRFRAAVDEDGRLVLVDSEIDYSRYSDRRENDPEDGPAGVLLKKVYFSHVSHDEIMNGESDFDVPERYYEERMLVLWGTKPPLRNKPDGESNPVGDRVDDVVAVFDGIWDEWVGARRTYARWELARTALLGNPDGYHEG